MTLNFGLFVSSVTASVSAGLSCVATAKGPAATVEELNLDEKKGAAARCRTRPIGHVNRTLSARST